LDRPRLLDLLGERSPIHIAADRAIFHTADAYRTAQHSPGLGRPPQGTTTLQAREAVDEFASLVERRHATLKA
jgi:hypothetical protein